MLHPPQAVEVVDSDPNTFRHEWTAELVQYPCCDSSFALQEFSFRLQLPFWHPQPSCWFWKWNELLVEQLGISQGSEYVIDKIDCHGRSVFRVGSAVQCYRQCKRQVSISEKKQQEICNVVATCHGTHKFKTHTGRSKNATIPFRQERVPRVNQTKRDGHVTMTFLALLELFE